MHSLPSGRVPLQRRPPGGLLPSQPAPLLSPFCQVFDLPLCRVLVCDDASYPCWLVLVPRVNRAREVLDLDAAQRAQLWREVEAAAAVVQVRTEMRESSSFRNNLQ